MLGNFQNKFKKARPLVLGYFPILSLICEYLNYVFDNKITASQNDIINIKLGKQAI